jgi:cell division protein FtsN
MPFEMPFGTTLTVQHRPSRQRGGTMLGFLIGGVVGLLAALIVAVFVTKVPVPFVNKAVNRNAEQDLAEAAKNKNWDPNAPLSGKQSGARPPEASGAVASAPAASSAAAAVVASAPVVQGNSLPGAPAPQYSASKAQEAAVKKPADAASKPADPLGDLVKAKVAQAQPAQAQPAAPSAPTPPAAADAKAGDAFFVQAGAYSNQADADAQKAKISLNGLEAKVSEREVSGRTVYRVRVGPVEKKADADKLRERLEGMGYDARVMTVSR